MEHKINIREYFEKGTFIIPEYQRGYKWPVNESLKESSLEHFLNSLIKSQYLDEYFIEAVTVVEENRNIIIVDGQQRTTSLILIFAVMEDFKFIDKKLIYKVRKDSQTWLDNLVARNKLNTKDEDIQDIFYFKKAINIIREKLKDIEEVNFSQFIKEKVFLLYNPIPKEKAVNTFIALNGLKAVMKDEELIKSDLLIKSSRINGLDKLNDKEKQFSIKWEINEFRGRLARNWDKWLYWWNQKDVKEYFGISNAQHPLYYLLVTYWKINCTQNQNESKEFSFDNFKYQFIENPEIAKQHFEGLRKLQKTFEDLFYDLYSHNYLGLIIKTSSNKEESLRYFLDSKEDDKIDLKEYALWSLVDATHLEIINDTKERIGIQESEKEIEIIVKFRKANDAISLINEKYVYWDENESVINDDRKKFAFRFLLLFNLLEDCKLNRRFDFSIWNNRSLEHIYPKSKSSYLKFDGILAEASIHCIGNLVLLYGRDNSSFGAKDFLEKKNTYFNTSSEFKSRNLLHTISVFSNSDWNEVEILENKKSIIHQLNNYYGIYHD